MKIRQLAVSGVAGLADGTFDFVNAANGAPHPIVFVTGPPASGKTRLLEAILAAKEDVAPYGARPSSAEIVRPSDEAAKIVVEWQLSEDEQSLVGAEQPVLVSESIYAEDLGPSLEHDVGLAAILGEYTHDPRRGKLDYFPAERTLLAGVSGAGALSVRVQREVRLTRDLRKYGWLSRFLSDLWLGVYDTDDDATSGRKRFAETFATLCKTKSYRGARRNDDIMKPVFSAGGGPLIGIEHLSRTEQQAAIFAATFMLIGLNRSVVLVDTPEVGLRGEDVAPFVAALAALGTDNQLIVATASKELLAGAPPQAVIHLHPEPPLAPPE